jgi:hypothetical protein
MVPKFARSSYPAWMAAVNTGWRAPFSAATDWRAAVCSSSAARKVGFLAAARVTAWSALRFSARATEPTRLAAAKASDASQGVARRRRRGMDGKLGDAASGAVCTRKGSSARP